MTAVAEDAYTASPPREERSRLGRNIAAMAGGQMITWTTSLIWTLIVPRALGPAGMGLIVTAWSVTGVLGLLLGLGTRNYLVRELVIRKEDSPRLLGTAMVLRLALSPLFVGAALIYARVTHMGHEAAIVLYLAVAATIFVQLAEPVQAGFQAIERMEYLAYSEVISKSAQGLIGVVIALVGLGAVGITGVWALMTGLVVVLDVVWLRARVRIDVRTTVARLVDMIRESMAYWAFGVFFTIYLWIDALMLSLLTRPEVVGWYGVPMKLFQTFMFLPVVLSTAWLPRLVRTHQDAGSEALRREARRPVELVLVLGIPVCAGIAVCARPFVDLIYGPDYSESVPVLTLLALSIPPMYLNIIISQVLVAAKRQRAWTMVMGGATLLNPALNAALIPLAQHRLDNGAIGAAISLLLTELAIVGVGLVLIGRGMFDGQVLRRIALTAVASACAWAASRLCQGLGTVASLAAALGVMALLAWALKLVPADELALVRANTRRLLPGRG